MGDKELEEKICDMQKYIPCLITLIDSLKQDPLKETQVKKMQLLYDLLTKRDRVIKLETLIKCEDILTKIYGKHKEKLSLFVSICEKKAENSNRNTKELSDSEHKNNKENIDGEKEPYSVADNDTKNTSKENHSDKDEISSDCTSECSTKEEKSSEAISQQEISPTNEIKVKRKISEEKLIDAGEPVENNECDKIEEAKDKDQTESMLEKEKEFPDNASDMDIDEEVSNAKTVQINSSNNPLDSSCFETEDEGVFSTNSLKECNIDFNNKNEDILNDTSVDSLESSPNKSKHDQELNQSQVDEGYEANEDNSGTVNVIDLTFDDSFQEIKNKKKSQKIDANKLIKLLCKEENMNADGETKFKGIEYKKEPMDEIEIKPLQATDNPAVVYFIKNRKKEDDPNTMETIEILDSDEDDSPPTKQNSSIKPNRSVDLHNSIAIKQEHNPLGHSTPMFKIASVQSIIMKKPTQSITKSLNSTGSPKSYTSPKHLTSLPRTKPTAPPQKPPIPRPAIVSRSHTAPKPRVYSKPATLLKSTVVSKPTALPRPTFPSKHTVFSKPGLPPRPAAYTKSAFLPKPAALVKSAIIPKTTTTLSKTTKLPTTNNNNCPKPSSNFPSNSSSAKEEKTPPSAEEQNCFEKALFRLERSLKYILQTPAANKNDSFIRDWLEDFVGTITFGGQGKIQKCIERLQKCLTFSKYKEVKRIIDKHCQDAPADNTTSTTKINPDRFQDVIRQLFFNKTDMTYIGLKMYTVCRDRRKGRRSKATIDEEDKTFTPTVRVQPSRRTSLQRESKQRCKRYMAYEKALENEYVLDDDEQEKCSSPPLVSCKLDKCKAPQRKRRKVEKYVAKKTSDKDSSDEEQDDGSLQDLTKNINPNHHCRSKHIEKCLLCNEKQMFIVSHYVNAHRTSEVLVSRVTRNDVEKLTKNLINFASLTPAKSTTQVYTANCIFCKKEMNFALRYWFEHYTMHTGEYGYECSKCLRRRPRRQQIKRHVDAECEHDNPEIKVIFDLDKSSNQIDGYVCKICNYIQIQKVNLIKHLQTQHDLKEITREHYQKVNLLSITKPYFDKFLDLDTYGQGDSNPFSNGFDQPHDFDQPNDLDRSDFFDVDDMSFTICNMLAAGNNDYPSNSLADVDMMLAMQADDNAISDNVLKDIEKC